MAENRRNSTAKHTHVLAQKKWVTFLTQKLYDTISERIELLSYYPEIGKTTNFRKILQISLGHYSILYRITDESILIYAIRDNRDDPKKL